MSPRPLKLSVVLIFMTIAAGLAIRRLPLHLPSLVTKYAGSMLWAVMVYWIVSTLLPRRQLLNVALVSAVVCAAVELLKLYHSSGLDAFRLTLPGQLLLGRIFSMKDIAAYFVAITLGAILDRRVRTITHSG